LHSAFHSTTLSPSRRCILPFILLYLLILSPLHSAFSLIVALSRRYTPLPSAVYLAVARSSLSLLAVLIAFHPISNPFIAVPLCHLSHRYTLRHYSSCHSPFIAMPLPFISPLHFAIFLCLPFLLPSAALLLLPLAVYCRAAHASLPFISPLHSAASAGAFLCLPFLLPFTPLLLLPLAVYCRAAKSSRRLGWSQRTVLVITL
jgi:hypothetical protein